MYCMLSCFNLNSDTTKDDFLLARNAFFAHLNSLDLIDSIGPLCERDRDTPMDTDDRLQQFYYLSYFVDKAQCDRYYQYILQHQGVKHPLHAAVLSKTCDEVFICYAELPDIKKSDSF